MDSHIEWLLSLAKIIQPKLTDVVTMDKIVEQYIHKTIETHTDSILVDKMNEVIDADYKYIIFTKDPYGFAKLFTQYILEYEDDHKTYWFKPITIITKLIRKEYLIDFNSSKLIYLIQANNSNQYLIDSIIFRKLANCKIFFKIDKNLLMSYVKLFNNKFNDIKINKSKPSYNNKQNSHTFRSTVLTKLLSELKIDEYDSYNNLILVSDFDHINVKALDMIFCKPIIKDTIHKKLKQIIKDLYPDFIFKEITHSNHYTPNDFRMKKFTFSMEKNKFKIYLINLYNTGSYDPLPCYLQSKQNIYDSHPFIKLRFLLLELNVLNMLEVSTANLQTEDYRNQIGNLIKNICNQILKSYDDKPLTWIGFFRDEEYDKIKYNQLHNTGQNNLFELVTS
jgi:hypothetical protein